MIDLLKRSDITPCIIDGKAYWRGHKWNWNGYSTKTFTSYALANLWCMTEVAP